jgi:ABC-type antimicrobial peptide transport system permease subunit
MRVAPLGLAIGLGCSLAVTQLLKSWLFEVKTIDPITLIAVALAIVVVTLCGSLFPALSAIRIDPVEALRQE